MKKMPPVAISLMAALIALSPGHALTATVSQTDMNGHVLVVTADGNTIAQIKFGAGHELEMAAVVINAGTDLTKELIDVLSMQGFVLTDVVADTFGEQTINLLAVDRDPEMTTDDVAVDLLDTLLTGPTDAPLVMAEMLVELGHGPLRMVSSLPRQVATPAVLILTGPLSAEIAAVADQVGIEARLVA